MEKKIMDVVGTMFFREGKLLIDKPRKRSTFQMIGGKVEVGESIKDAAYRECVEELGNNVILDLNKFVFVMDFIEIATSDPNLKIHMHVFKYNDDIKGELLTSDEIQSFMWFGIDDDYNLLSNTLKNEVVPYAIKKNLIYVNTK
ncbi:MAG: NUDIX domain-containing protein [Bacilli bacterium]|nr:NUDIX domain-containing protein [Bacilli bacterium]